MKKNLLVSKQKKLHLESIDFVKANSSISFQDIYDSLHKAHSLALSIVGFLVIIIEVLISASISGWLVSKPIFAVVQWSIVFITLFYFFKTKVKANTKKYLTKYFSRCTIVLLISSLIFSLSIWIIFLSFSATANNVHVFQIVCQVVISVFICLLLEGIIYLYLSGKIIEELSAYIKDIKTPFWVKAIEKGIGFVIAIVLVAMQFYRINKFWLISSSKLVATLISIGQFVLCLLTVSAVLILPIMLFYPEIVKNYMIDQYSEAFRKEYDFTKEEWYGE